MLFRSVLPGKNLAAKVLAALAMEEMISPTWSMRSRREGPFSASAKLAGAAEDGKEVVTIFEFDK